MKKFLLIFGVAAVISAVIVYMALPAIANHFLHKYGYPEVQITKLSINPFALKTTVGLKASGGINQKLKVGAITVNLAWRPLFNKEVHVENISLHRVGVDVQQHQNESLLVGAVMVSTGVPQPSTTTSESFYHLTLKSANFSNGAKPFLMAIQNKQQGFDLSLDGKISLRNLDIGLLPPNLATSTTSRLNDKDLKDKLMHVRFSGDINLNEFFYKTIKSTPPQNSEIKVQSASLSDESKIQFRDESLSPPFEINMTTITFRVSQVDSTKPNQLASLVFSAHLGQFDRVLINGSLTPFAKAKSGDIKAKIESLDLTRFSPLTERYIGYQLESGVLDLESDTSIKNDFLKGTNKLHIHKLELDRLKKNEKDELTEQLGIPLNTLLTVLRDKNKDIRLSVPIEGDLSNPEVGIGHVIRKAIRKGTVIALRKTIETAFPVLKTARLAGTLAKFALKMRFDDLIFEAGKSELTQTSQTYLNEVGPKLVKKEKVRINICGRIAPADLAILTSATEEEKTVLGKKRSEIVKNYLIDNFQIDQKRLFLCTPEIDNSEKSQPRVELSL